MASASAPVIPFLPYRLFFLYLEPISALAGAYYAAAKPAEYLQDLDPTDTVSNVYLSTQTKMSLYQLANLYLLFALSEHLVLSSATSLRTWKRLLFCFLIADFGHLATMMWTDQGTEIFWNWEEWNAMAWGSIGLVYMGASLRMAFLLGVGMNEPSEGKHYAGEWNVKKNADWYTLPWISHT
ncbi:hypothetical protein JAAARDRAFT_33757 [Jaapia argillacea MUCL 33604]|uniref:DUF7704 domain-containing protein n=1 Tax=Jaapia argillacea MUCL 33604 TaxID=933084 RepID=A0A067PW39_9AGAM|nr:hypothetical protein JAAARDRAFT_33757 [Jaapia argillacea MUCL 33604]